MKKLLIADDDITSRVLLQAILERWGYEVVVTQNGKDALMAMLKKDAPQMALLDWMMPEMDGPTLCRVLKENSRPEPLYLIMITTRTAQEDIVDGLNAGADDYIAKPYDNKELMARISAGFRSLDLQKQLKDYSMNMERLARERAAQLIHADRMVALGILSAGIAHEINNPASFVSINVQVLEENWPVIDACLRGCATDNDKERALMVAREIPAIFSEMRNGISRIKAIVDGLKSYTRSDGVRYAETSVEASIEEALKMCWNRLKHLASVTRRFAPDLPRIIADGRRLEQVFVNLFINAADAMEAGGGIEKGELVITTGVEADHLVITIRDSGPGFTDKDQRQLFSLFYTTKGIGKGTGLGLSISQGIIKDHGGTLTAGNAEGGGAEFRISLPPVKPKHF